MSDRNGLVKAPPRSLVRDGKAARPGTAAHARLELQATRARVLAELEAVTRPLPHRWRKVVAQRPLLAIGGVLALGWLLGRLTRR